MSYEARYHFGLGVRLADVVDFLELLGCRKESTSLFFGGPNTVMAFGWWETRDYQSRTGLYLHIDKIDDGHAIYLRSRAGRSYWDVRKLNEIVRALRKRFGGYFQTDFGRNRYFPLPEHMPSPSEAGCELALGQFESALQLARIYLNARQFTGSPFSILPSDFHSHLTALQVQLDPHLLSNHLLLPFFVSAMEDYYKTAFIAIFRDSLKKESVLRNARLSAHDLSEISNGNLGVEEAFAKSLSFQSPRLIVEHFRRLDSQIDLLSVQRKPIARQTVSIFDSLEQLVMRRHAFIHQGHIGADLTDKALERWLDHLSVVGRRVHGHFAATYGWPIDAQTPTV